MLDFNFFNWASESGFLEGNELQNLCEQIVHLATLESQSRSEVNTKIFVDELRKRLTGEISLANFVKLGQEIRLVDYIIPQFLLNFEHWSCLFSLVSDEDSTINEETQELFSLLKSTTPVTPAAVEKAIRLAGSGYYPTF